MRLALLLTCIVTLSSSLVYSQSKENIQLMGIVYDIQTNKKLTFATVVLESDNGKQYTATSDSGLFSFSKLIEGTYKVQISYIGYTIWTSTIEIDKDKTLTCKLTPTQHNLQEIVVTASDIRGMTSTSVIKTQALEHLQPSSFTDLLELLPGGKSLDPQLTRSNTIKLREVGISDSKYSTSLGTSFIVDGAPISTDANMQYTVGTDLMIGKNEGATKKRNTTDRGVDMRTISTDQIERVEIIRGIPSVRYGNITTGVVKIERKKGYTPLETRFKADGLSKLFYIGKGIELVNKQICINGGIDYLNAKADPTNNFENYERLTASIRLQKIFNGEHSKTIYNSNLDVSLSIDNEKTDPDNDFKAIDKYHSHNNRYSWSNNLSVYYPNATWLEKIDVKSVVSFENDVIEQTKFIQLTSPQALPINTLQGEYNGMFLPGNWVSHSVVDGKPFNYFTQATAKIKTPPITTAENNLLFGVEFSFDKNWGKGQLFNPQTPPSQNVSIRNPRPYYDIPADIEMSYFVEDNFVWKIAKHIFSIEAGVRAVQPLNIPKEYSLSGKMYIDPRANFQYTLPDLILAGDKIEINISSGIGWHSKFPTLNQLYPDYVYNDHVQINYYHNNPSYRMINLMPYKNKNINYEIEPAINRKWELRTQASYRGNQISLTYFNEVLSNGFRNETTLIQSQPYKMYDISAIDHNTITARPDLTQVPYRIDTALVSFSATTNGSSVLKRGIEFTISSKRFENIKTRFTLNGAWMSTIYTNSMPIYYAPNKIIGGQQMQEIGIYQSEGGYTREELSTNLMIDTYIPAFDLIFSSSIQATWFHNKQTRPYSSTPTSYITVDGNRHPYTDAQAQDYRLQWLNRTPNPLLFQVETTPLALNVNIKATKKIKNKIRLSLFVNRIFSYHPDYKINEAIISRKVTPYFGMEINLNI